jgi:hypothetical protein
MSDDAEIKSGINFELFGHTLDIIGGIKATLDDMRQDALARQRAEEARWSLQPRPYVISTNAAASSGFCILPIPRLPSSVFSEVREIIVGPVVWPTSALANAVAVVGVNNIPTSAITIDATTVRDQYNVVPNGAFYSRGQFPLNSTDYLWVALIGSGITSGEYYSATAVLEISG